MVEFHRLNFTEKCYTALIALLCILFMRLSMCLPQFREGMASRRRKKEERVSSMVIWGSGGHTTEMLRLIDRLDVKRYAPMHFVMASSDQTSRPKIESTNVGATFEAIWHLVPRSREVKQPWITSIFTTAWAAMHSFLLVVRVRPDVVICNGPGTCVPIAWSAFAVHLLGIAEPTIIFAESFCRVKSLSLTARLLYPIADKFIVQWPELAEKYPRAEYLGTMI